MDLAGLVHAGLMPPEQDVNSRWKPDPARILPALVAWIAAAALVLPMADTKAQGASAGIEGTAWRVEAIRGPAVTTAPAPPDPGALVFTCDDVEFLVRVSSSQVELVLLDRTLVLPQVPAASGAKYQQGSTLFWNRGDEARFEVDGRTYPACTRRSG